MRGLLLLIVLFSSFVAHSQSYVVDTILVSGNKDTKRHIILRELLFKEGDTLNVDKEAGVFKRSQNNLLNTSLFNFVNISRLDTLKKTAVLIKVTERWYLWPEVIIKFQDRNFTEWLKNPNLNRVDWGLFLTRNNFRGRNEKLQLQTFVGFTQKFGLEYSVPYLTKSMKNGLKIGGSYATQNEVFSGIKNNEMIYIKNDEEILLSRVNVYAEYTRRNGIYLTHHLSTDYFQINLFNELSDQTDRILGSSAPFQRYFTLRYFMKLDHRDSRNYPLHGYYIDAELKQIGLGKLGLSDFAFTTLSFSARQYNHPIGRWFTSIGTFQKVFNNPNVPFVFQDGLGFSNYVRSYEPFVVYGQFASLIKTNLKYQLVKPGVYKIPWLNFKKFDTFHYAFYVNWFVDAGYVYQPNDPDNSRNNNFLYGGGMGLDFVTYYDLVLRLEYSINKEKQHGLYISFTAPI